MCVCVCDGVAALQGRQVSSVWEEIRFNTRLTKTKDKFIHLMNNLGLPKPAKIDIVREGGRMARPATKKHI